MFKKMVAIVPMVLLLVGCSSSKKEDISYMEAATLWMQNAAEVRALTYQAFNAAKLSLDSELRKRHKKPLGIVLDIDETVLDNSPYQAKNILEGRTYNDENWSEWIDEKRARPLAGAVEFLNYAESKGVDIFYISNRKVKSFEATYENMKKVGLPVKKENLFLKTHSNSKDKRRKVVFQTHNIVLLFGDTLADFATEFDEKNSNERNILVDHFRREFGRKFIVLPNPMYGDWEWALHEYDYSKENKEREQERQKYLYP